MEMNNHKDIEFKTKTKNIVFQVPLNYNKVVTTELIDSLINIGKENNKITRLCLHDTNEALLHTMIIFLPKDEGYKLHMHPYKNENYSILFGNIEFCITSDPKEDIDRFLLNKQNPIFYANKEIWHSLKAVDDYAVYIENRQGPFKPLEDDETIWYEEGNI